jgi:type II secretory pathway pseudopilin PulG
MGYKGFSNGTVSIFRRRFDPAFTLIELLVVISVIMLLATMLLPVSVRAKSMAKRTQCLNNHHQLATIYMLYSSDNGDWLAPNGQHIPPSPNQRTWVQGVMFYPDAKTNAAYLLDPTYALFADYIQAGRVYVCPGDSPSVSVGSREWPRVRSYSLNAYLGWVGRGDDRLSRERVFARSHHLSSSAPAGIFSFADVHPDSICSPYFGVYTRQEAFFNLPGSAHDRAGVVSFADGHAETRYWRDNRTVADRTIDHRPHYEESPGNPDLAWLRAHTTVLEPAPNK